MNVEIRTVRNVRRRKSHRIGRRENRKIQLMTLAARKQQGRCRRKEKDCEIGSQTSTRKRKPGHSYSQHAIGDNKEGVPQPSVGSFFEKHNEEEVLPRFPAFSTLNTGKLYVQATDEHFKATKLLVPSLSPSPLERHPAEANDGRRHVPITFAILLQRFLDTVGFISRGFLAGMALTHFLMIHVVFSNYIRVALNPVELSRISELYSNLFACLNALCLTSVLDKILVMMPPSSRDCSGEVVAAMRAKTLLTLPFYLIGHALHLLSAQIDQAVPAFFHCTENLTDTAGTIQQEEFDRWQRIAKMKDLAAILAWLLECFDAQPDTFLLSLKAMAKGGG